MKSESVCQACGINPAAVFINTSDAGEKMQLCVSCAQKKQEESTMGLQEFFEKASMTILGPEAKQKPAEESEPKACTQCGLTLQDFEKLGLIGCPTCYKVFEQELSELLKRIHGSFKHIGSRPRPRRVFASTPDIAALRAELHQAIEQENFERAAEFRDLIRDLEREQHRSEDSNRVIT